MSEQKEKILRFYKGTEGEEASVRLVEFAEQVKRTQKFRVSNFLDPFAQGIAEVVASNYGVALDFDGGFFGAERKRAILKDAAFEGSPNVGIAVVEAEWNGEFVRLSHRDVLGSLMALGIKRELLGDILATRTGAKILTTAEMGSFLLENLVRIGEASVSCTLGNLTDIAPKEERCKEIRATVASLRIDAIAAAGFGISRSHVADDIAADKLKLNWQSIKNASKTVKEGDVISMRGRGRVEIAEVKGLTKKGRTGILLKRYL